MRGTFFLSRVAVALAVGATLLGQSGCKKGISGAKVHGQVTYKDQPLPSGEVLFFKNGGMIGQSVVSDGHYEIYGLPTGEVQIAVKVNLNPGMPITPTQPEMPKSAPTEMTPEEMKEKMEQMMRSGRGPMMPPGRGGPGMPPGMSGPGGMPGPGGMRGGPPGPMPPGMAGMPPIPDDKRKELEEINERYGDPEKSGLTYTVEAGDQTHDIILKK